MNDLFSFLFPGFRSCSRVVCFLFFVFLGSKTDGCCTYIHQVLSSCSSASLSSCFPEWALGYWYSLLPSPPTPPSSPSSEFSLAIQLTPNHSLVAVIDLNQPILSLTPQHASRPASLSPHSSLSIESSKSQHRTSASYRWTPTG